jgi:eukaryotic-like serine/threonine-protein kinase
MGVAKAHEAGVIHRDIKPANIFLAQGVGGAVGVRTVKVLDFGVAKIRRDPGDVGGDGTSGGLTRTGSILGSPLYMSPEQARSVKNIDHRSDLWSLGVVLYQSLAGRTPFDHISGLGDLILALCSELPPPVQQFAPWVSPDIARIIDQALRIDPRERFQTATEMLDAVQELLPVGSELRDEMLVALDGGTQDNIAPSYFRRPVTMPLGRRMGPDAFGATMPTPISLSAGAVTPHPVERQSSAEHAGPQSTQTSVATTGTGLPDTASRNPSPPAPRQVSTIIVALACVVAGGAGVYAVTRPAGAPAVQVAAIGPSATSPPAVAPPPVAAVPVVALAIDAGADTAAPVPSPVPTPAADASKAAPSVHPHAAATASVSKGAPPIDYNSFGGRK